MKKRKSRLRFTKEERQNARPPGQTRPVKKAASPARKPGPEKPSSPPAFAVPSTRYAHPSGKPDFRAAFRLFSNTVQPEKQEEEEENVGVDAARQAGQAAKTGSRLLREEARHHRTVSSWRPARIKRTMPGEAPRNFSQPSAGEPAASNPLSRWQQRRAIKRAYAEAHRGYAGKAAAHTGKAAAGASGRAKKGGQTVWRHRRGFGILLAVVLVLALSLNGLSACTVLFQTAASSILSTTYPSRDEDMLGAEEAYAEKEAALQEYLDNYELTHDYDEYHFDLDPISHDPYVLISLLTAYHEGEWTLGEVSGTLDMLFDMQYILTERVEVETRTRTETSTDPVTGETVQREVSYPYTICYVTLENTDLSHLPAVLLDEDRLGLYAGYMATLGNRPDLFPKGEYPGASEKEDYLDYELPPEALEDKTFAAMLEEAEKYLGFPYVWGGSSPSTSFDCSGYISWVINHTGWDVGRLNANGLLNICTPIEGGNARPGDLIFFEGTYDTTGASHVGLYVGNNMMIHCGDPISYARIDTDYWQQHFYTFARLP